MNNIKSGSIGIIHLSLPSLRPLRSLRLNHSDIIRKKDRQSHSDAPESFKNNCESNTKIYCHKYFGDWY